MMRSRMLHLGLSRLMPLLLVLLAGCDAYESREETTLVRLGEQCFSIPSTYARAIHASAMPPWQTQELTGLHMTLLFPSSELEGHVAGYVAATSNGRVVESNVRVSVVAASASDLRGVAYKALNLDKAIWEGSGEYQTRSVEKAKDYFRVCPGGSAASSCMLTNADPDIDGTAYRAPDFWFASCSIRGRDKIPICLTDVADEQRGWVFNMSLGEENIQLRESVARYVAAKMGEWSSEC